MNRYPKLKICCIALLLLTLTAALALAGQERGRARGPKLARLVDIHSVAFHQKMLMRIAEKHDDNRAAGTEGYEAASRYLQFWLWLAGYEVEVQAFDFPFFQELADPLFALSDPPGDIYTPNDPAGFYTMTYSGGGDVMAAIAPVDLVLPPAEDPNTSTSGCEAEDFEGFVAGSVALIQRGSCAFYDKAMNAQKAGAAAVIVFNEGQAGRTDAIRGTLGSPEFEIPVIFASFDIGNALADAGQPSVQVVADTISETRTSHNLLARVEGREPGNTVMVGAHLDSVLDGPGINDNGSGCAALLDAALKMGWWRMRPKHSVVFAFWGAEELGLIGSEHYVAQLDEAALAEIGLYLNFDMIASPNYVRFVFDGDGSDTDIAGPPGSEVIEAFFNDHFAGKGLASDPTALDGRSDYDPFMTAGIPVGGLFTGAGGIKTDEQAAVYGGTAGEPYDANYHTPEDNLDNLNLTVEKQMLKAMARAVDHFAGNPMPERQMRVMAQQRTAGASMREFKGPLALR